jgi:P27 family predicted phage terminase small subunit
MTAFRLYCDAYETYTDATRNIRKFGSIIKTPKGFLMTSPWVLLANKAQSQMRWLMGEFGMTPVSRSRVEVGGEPTDQEKVEEFLFGPKRS